MDNFNLGKNILFMHTDESYFPFSMPRQSDILRKDLILIVKIRYNVTSPSRYNVIKQLNKLPTLSKPLYKKDKIISFMWQRLSIKRKKKDLNLKHILYSMWVSYCITPFSLCSVKKKIYKQCKVFVFSFFVSLFFQKKKQSS